MANIAGGFSVHGDLNVPSHHQGFWGNTTTRGNTESFCIRSRLALLSAAIASFFFKPLTADGMVEDEGFWVYLELHDMNTIQTRWCSF